MTESQQHRFLVGLSIDGPRELHDRYRVMRSGKPTFDKVMKGVEVLKKYQVPFNALVTVNRTNARFPLEVYRFMTQALGATYVQFNPCVEPVDFKSTAPQFWREDTIPVTGTRCAKPGDLDSIVTDWSVEPEDWGKFLIAVFEEWVNNDLGRVQVNLFETAVAQVMGMPAQICTASEFCSKGWPSRRTAIFIPATTTSIRNIRSVILKIPNWRTWPSLSASRPSAWGKTIPCRNTAKSALT